MTIQLHDFSRPPSLHPETRARLLEWLTRANALLAETMSGFAIHVENRLEDCFTAWPVESLQEWPEKAFAFRVKLADVSAFSAIAVPNPLAQILIGGLMGEKSSEWPAERDLTDAEVSVGQFLTTNIVKSLIDGWAGESILDLRVDEPEANLRRTKIFRMKEPFIVCRSTMTTPIGSGQWCWILPHDFLVKLFGNVRASNAAAGVSSREQLETLARDMTTKVTVRLGSVQLSAPQLSNLRVGDLVVLNQKTTEPLRAFVSGKPKFLGWPGRVGNRQAFELAADGKNRAVGGAAEMNKATGTAAGR